MRNFLVIFILLGVFSSCAPKNTPAVSTAFSGSIKVMSYNIHHCNPPSKKELIDVNAISNVIKEQTPDIVALQEVDVNINRSGNINEAKLLAEKSGYPYFHFSKAIDYDGGDYGVAIMSKYPLSDIKTYNLPTVEGTNGEPRVLSLATVTLPGDKKIKFGCTHLDAQRKDINRLAQIKKITEITSGITLPMIIAGDFNDTENSATIQLLKKIFTITCTTCAPTIPEVNPVKTIDFVAYKPADFFTVSEHKVIDEPYASDHLPVVATLRLLK
ncbi:MAG: endonuclease/exonuclease/phosphatase family protein [Niabella sp.]